MQQALVCAFFNDDLYRFYMLKLSIFDISLSEKVTNLLLGDKSFTKMFIGPRFSK